MHRNYPMNELKNDPRYHSALGVLQTILHREVPTGKVLSDIFGTLTPMVIFNVKEHFEAFPRRRIKIRRHTDDPSIISEARVRLEDNFHYAKLHSLILNGELPHISDISPIYGEYSETVQDILAQYQRFDLRRRCGIPAAAHISRVGGLVYTLGFDSPGTHKFCTAAFLHDCIEDLITYERKDTSDHYGLKGLELFIDDYIPSELQPNIRLLTNRYSLILNYLSYLLTLSDTPVNKKTLLREINSLCSWEWSLNESVKNLSSLLKSKELNEPALANAKWQCYRELYIKEMADHALALSDFRTFEIKAIDLCDNAHGSAALSLPDKIKNIIKLGIWANQGYRLHTNWTPTNNFIQELYEAALVYSEHLVIKDFLEPVSKLDFFVSALLKIEELESIFYVE